MLSVARIASLVLAVAASFQSAQAQTAPEKVQVNICGGGSSGTYIKVAKYLKYRLESSGGAKLFDVKVYETKGSKENIEALNDGRCQVAVLQNDATEWFKSEYQVNTVELKLVSEIYTEHAHMLCHRDLNVKAFSDLESLSKSNKATVFVGAESSGGAMMLENLINFYKNDYAGIVPMPNDDRSMVDPISKKQITIDRTQNAIQLAAENKACAFFVTRAPYKYLKDLNPNVAAQLNMVSLDDNKFNNLKDSSGRRIYDFVKFADISSEEGDNIYANLRAYSSGWFSGSAEYTLGVSADLVVNSTWEQDIMGQLSYIGLNGTVQRWNNTLGVVQKFNGNFQQIDSLLRGVTSEAIPESAQ